MRIVVLGSGVIGITTAYYLAQDGHEVTVLDRQPGPARETSFANAGEISPGCSRPSVEIPMRRNPCLWITRASSLPLPVTSVRRLAPCRP